MSQYLVSDIILLIFMRRQVFFDIYIINVFIPTQGIKFQGSYQKMEKKQFLNKNFNKNC